MTIIFTGHIESISVGHLGKVKLEIYGQKDCLQEPVFIEATTEEADVYRVGMQVQFQITPTTRS